jgi:hypothetical protein
MSVRRRSKVMMLHARVHRWRLMTVAMLFRQRLFLDG